MPIKIILTSIWLLAFMIFGVKANCQTEDQPIIKRTHHVYAGFDLWGVTALPLSTVLIKNKKSNSRLLGKIQYIYDEKFALDVAYGVDHKEADVVRTNFSNYTMDAEYFQVLVHTMVVSDETLKSYMGVGVTFGNIMESGVVEIGDTYFDPFNEILQLDEPFIGWVASLKLEKKLNERFSLEGDMRAQSIKINKQPIQVLHALPGGGKSWMHRRYTGFEVNLLLSIKYRLF